MHSVALSAEGLGKCYRIGSQPKSFSGFGHRLIHYTTKPFQNWYQLKKLNNTKESEDVSEDIFWALKDLNFSVNHGEAVGVIGKNGAGKSTLLKLLSRITTPSRGRVTLKGKIASLLEVGTGFHPELPGRDNIFINGAILGMSRIEIKKKFDEIVEFSGVSKFIDTPVKRYSSGMKVRLAFAVAAHLDPEILLIDEVLAVGDMSFQKKCLNKMQDLLGRERTILFVSHNSAAVTRLCDRVLYLEDGKLIMDGPSEKVMAKYLSGGRKLPHVMNWNENNCPGSDEVILLHASIENINNHDFDLISVEDELRLVLRYRVLKRGISLRCGAIFYTQGVCAFGTAEPRENIKNKVGDYTTTVTIPANLLAEGEYSVGLNITAHKVVKVKHVMELDVLSFNVYDPLTGNSAAGENSLSIAGVVMPKLVWNSNE